MGEEPSPGGSEKIVELLAKLGMSSQGSKATFRYSLFRDGIYSSGNIVLNNGAINEV